MLRGSVGIAVFAGDDGKEYVPENNERYAEPEDMCGKADGHDCDANQEEEVLHGVGFPRHIFEIEFQREHRQFAYHKDVGEEREPYQQKGKNRFWFQ